MERDCGLCQVCAKKGKTTLAQAVDHIVSKANAAKLKWATERIDAESNLQAICDPCHLIKGQEEMGKKAPRLAVKIGVDGFPIEAPHAH